MSIKQIKKEYKKEKKNLKKKYKEDKRIIQNNYVEDIDYFYTNEYKKVVINPPYRKTINEIGNAISHGIGSILAVFALVILIVKSNTPVQVISSIIYTLGLFFMFTMSCLYHSFKYGSKVKRLFRRFDYASIYLLIGATYTPCLLLFLHNDFGLIFCIIQWVIIITGITFISIFGPTKLRKIHLTLYVILGWSAIFFLPKMITGNFNFFLWILGGGVVYSLGIIPFALNKGPAHFIWHILVLLGSIIQFFGIFIHLY